MSLSPLIKFGTSTWAYEGWRGTVYTKDYPKGRFKKDCLAEYAAYRYKDVPHGIAKSWGDLRNELTLLRGPIRLDAESRTLSFFLQYHTMHLERKRSTKEGMEESRSRGRTAVSRLPTRSDRTDLRSSPCKIATCALSNISQNNPTTSGKEPRQKLDGIKTNTLEQKLI
jgi:hypothetical protein